MCCGMCTDVTDACVFGLCGWVRFLGFITYLHNYNYNTHILIYSLRKPDDQDDKYDN